MAIYEYRCRTCDTRFEARRPMADADEPIACPDGHSSAMRLMSAFASTGRSATSAASMPLRPTGGCGGACACHPG
jgi:putative FmdB family regulatory protein